LFKYRSVDPSSKQASGVPRVRDVRCRQLRDFPEQLTLHIWSDDLSRLCRVVTKTDKRVTVSFE
jgi:hypothetical protein